MLTSSQSLLVTHLLGSPLYLFQREEAADQYLGLDGFMTTTYLDRRKKEKLASLYISSPPQGLWQQLT